MAELLLELLSEEIPARMQDRAAADLKRLVCERLEKAGLTFETAEAFATPRRLALVVDGLPTAQPDVTEQRKGPRADAPEKAIAGFLKSIGLTRDQVEERETPKGTVLFAVIERHGAPTAEVLAGLLPGALAAMGWPKSMRWGDHPDRWVRPLHGLLCLFDGAAVPVGFGPLDSGDGTVGHRFMAPDEFAVSDFNDYREKLRTAYVMLDAAERREVIEQDAALKAKAEGLTVAPDAALIAENAGLVEWPVVLAGAIEPDYLDLPPEVLTTAMRSHQKYFTLTDADGKMAPRFLMVANAIAGDGGKQIVAGNERVLRARLADAKFFWDTDRKRTLESRVADLDGVTFHAKLGTLGDKAKRIEALAVEIGAIIETASARWTNVGDATSTKSAIQALQFLNITGRAARLAKADLTTQMVQEFPELQGVMGGHYARGDRLPPEVAEAITEHYSPQGPTDACPSAPVSVCVALADKIDTLAGFWAIDEKPTGSKDPFALRRAALGVIRLVVENQIRFGLVSVFDTSFDLVSKLFAGAVGVALVDWSGRTKKVNQRSVDLLGFFVDRLKVYLRESGVRHDLVSAVFALGGEDDLVRLLARVEALGAFVASEDGEHLLTAYRRAANIVRIEEKRDGVSYGEAAVDPALLREADEKAVAERLSELSGLVSAALEREDFATAMTAMATLRGPVDSFFDNVTVNCDDADLRRNRLLLLGQIRATLDRVADFSKIEG